MLGTIKCMVICGLVAVVCGQVPPVVVVPVDEIFLFCLCDALVTPCNHNRGCSTTSTVTVCGPFGIVEGYWIDGGSHTVPDDHSKNREKLAYQTCALDLPCAAKTVEGYMSGSRRRDCNKDGVIDATDYALTHWIGGYGPDCSYDHIVATNDTTGITFYRKFDECKKKFTAVVSDVF